MTTLPISALDVPLTQLVARVAERRLTDGLAAESRHQLDLADTAFATLAVTHPDACSTAADYPGWDTALAAMVAKNERAGGAL